jgi:tetratricopeptide (TPR) repeat protein
MADVKIDLQVAHKEFLASLEQTAKAIEALTKAAGGLEKSQDSLKKSSDDLAKSQNNLHQQSNQLHGGFGTLQSGLAGLNTGALKLVAAFTLLYGAAKTTYDGIAGSIKFTISSIDQFNTAAIGTAAAITNLSDSTQNAGRTVGDVFLQNLKATKGTFIELERLAAKYFASSIDLQLAYNTFAQRGVIIRKAELEQLAQVTDLILLLTGGQQSTIQIQEEIRSLINGTLRSTSQLSQLIRAFGGDVDAIGERIRITQSLKPLEGILQGSKAATGEIQKTFQATLNGLETVVAQVTRIAGTPFFEKITESITRFTKFLNDNKKELAAFGAVVGTAIGKGVEGFIKFAEVFLSGKDISKQIAPIVDLAALLTTIGAALGHILEVVLLLIRNLPIAAITFLEVFNAMDPKNVEKAQDSFGNFLDFLQSRLTDLVRSSPLGQLVEGAAKAGGELTAKVIPGMEKYEKAIKATSEAIKVLGTGMEQIGKFDFAKTLADNQRDFQKAIREVQDGIRANLNAPSTAITAPTKTPLIENTAAVQQTENLQKQLREAQIRADRFLRQFAERTISSEIDADIQKLRREFSLLEEGAIIIDGVLTGVRSTTHDVAMFTQKNVADLSKGADVYFTDLIENVRGTTEGLIEATFRNLKNQFKVLSSGFEQFATDARAAAEKLADDEAMIHEQNAKKIRETAETNHNAIMADLIGFVNEAGKKVDEARAKGDKAGVEKALTQLKEAQQILTSQQEVADQLFNKKLGDAALEEQIAAVKRLGVARQTEMQIEVERLKLVQEQARVEQALSKAILDRANAAVANQQQRLAAVSLQAANAQPRTELQTTFEGINQQRLASETEFAKTIGGLEAVRNSLKSLADEGNASAIESIRLVEAKKEEVFASQDAIRASFDVIQAQAAYKTALDAVGNAAKSGMSTLLDSVLGSFEGKKTNFAQAFKGIADNLVRDSMKNVFDSVGKTFKDAFSGVFNSIAKDLPKEMQSSLSGAFTAGLGLIASFVLGQLMGDRGGSATASNPTVGIQSTEQVRGLIGGQTQIPIGQIGESLQDALVPTNVLLARIARAVEGQVGGLNTAQIDAVVSRMVGDALQIQGV